MRNIKIGKHDIGENSHCYIIAEIGVNHEGDVAIAKRMMTDAANAGASAVKCQIVRADSLYSNNDRKGNKYYRLFKQAELSEDEYHDLKSYADKLGVDFFASFNDRYGVDVSRTLKMPAFKIASTQLANLPLIDYVARQGKPIILSTGMSSASNVDDAVDVILANGNEQVVILHCVSNYPSLPEQVNLKTLDYLRKYDFPVGFSDHSLGNLASMIAVAKGASVIEKHFTFDKQRQGFDHALSFEPIEFAQLVKSIRSVESMLGSGIKRICKYECESAEKYSVRLVAAVNIAEHELIRDTHISASRNKEGIPCSLWKHLIGKKARRAIKVGEVFRWSDLDNDYE